MGMGSGNGQAEVRGRSSWTASWQFNEARNRVSGDVSLGKAI